MNSVEMYKFANSGPTKAESLNEIEGVVGWHWEWATLSSVKLALVKGAPLAPSLIFGDKIYEKGGEFFVKSPFHENGEMNVTNFEVKLPAYHAVNRSPWGTPSVN